MQNLKHLNVKINHLTGSIAPDLKCSNLKVLSVSGNLLTGDNTIRDIRLNRQEALVTGTLPTALGLLSKIRQFSTSVNFFTGTIPSEIGAFSAIGWLNYCIIRDVVLLAILTCKIIM
jgi:hypothetical protein